MRHPDRLSLAIAAFFVLAGFVIGGIAVVTLTASTGNDVAWASLWLGIGLVTWGVRFSALDTRAAPDAAADDGTRAAVSLTTELVTSGIVLALGYVLLRTVSDIPPLLCLVAALVVVGFGTVERVLRRRRRRPTAG